MGPLGVPELIIIFIVALLVFGPRKLPELGKSLGRGLSEFRRASNELRNTLEEEVRAAEREPPPPPTKPVEPMPAAPQPTVEGDNLPPEKTSAEAEQGASPAPPRNQSQSGVGGSLSFLARLELGTQS